MWWMVQHWNRLPRVAVESPTVEIFKTQLDWGPGQPSARTVLEREGGVERGDPQSCLLTKTIL